MSIYTEEAERKAKDLTLRDRAVILAYSDNGACRELPDHDALPPMFKAYVKRSGKRALNTERMVTR